MPDTSQDNLATNDEFDFDQATGQAWQLFTGRLAEVVSMIEDGASLTLGTDPDGDDPAPWVRFSCLSRANREEVPKLFVEASSNASVGEGFQLGLADLEAMDRIGWQAPTWEGDHPSENFWVLLDQEDCDQAAALAVATLREVFDVLHPVFLAADQLADVLTPAGAPENPSPRPRAVLEEHDLVATLPRDHAHLDRMVGQELEHMLGHEPIQDSEGDYAIRTGSSIVFVRCVPDAREVLVFSPLVHDVEGRSRAVEVLNDLNAESRMGRFSLYRDRVFVSVSVMARPFVPAHLHEAVATIGQLADAIDDGLAAKLRGRVSFTEES